jgi:hypothetical protein
MSRSALCTLTCLLVLAGLAAGPDSARAMRYEGIVAKAGAGFMFSGGDYRFDGAELLDGDTQIGAAAGVSTLWRWSRRSVWMLVLGVDYLQKGYSGTRELPGVDTEPTDIDALGEFLSIPVLGRVHFVEDKLTMYAVFGPSLEFRLSHDDDALLDEGKDFALAANVGIGFEYSLGEQLALQLEGKYMMDLTDSWDGGDLYTVESHRNQAFLVTGGLRF